jgi:hypothetical protein
LYATGGEDGEEGERIAKKFLISFTICCDRFVSLGMLWGKKDRIIIDTNIKSS